MRGAICSRSAPCCMKCSQAGARLAAILERELSDCDDWIFSPIYVQFGQLVAGLDMCHEECPLVSQIWARAVVTPTMHTNASRQVVVAITPISFLANLMQKVCRGLKIIHSTPRVAA